MRRHPVLLVVPWLVGVALLPDILGSRWTDVATLTFIATIGAVALNIISGTAGQMSLGNAALMAVGAYTAAALTTNVPDIPFLLVLPLAGIAGGVVGLAVGVPALRLAGLYLVMSTLALHFIVQFVAERYQLAEAGVAGFLLPRPDIFGFALDDGDNWLYFTAAAATASLLLYRNLLRSKFGRAWLGIHHREQAAEALGVNVSRYKFIAFGVSSALIGVQGAIFGYYLYGVEIQTFSLALAISFIAMIIIGGMGSPFGSLLGAIFVTALPFAVQDVVGGLPRDAPGVSLVSNQLFEIQSGLYGLAIIIFLLVEPTGLLGLGRRIRGRMRPGRRSTPHAEGVGK